MVETRIQQEVLRHPRQGPILLCDKVELSADDEQGL